MGREKRTIGLALFILGFVGIMSTMTLDLAIPEEVSALFEGGLTEQQLRIRLLITPTFVLLASVIIGSLLFDQMSFNLPFIEKFVYGRIIYPDPKQHLITGLLITIISILLFIIILRIFQFVYPGELEMLAKYRPAMKARLMFRALTEEVVGRFGLVTLFSWVCSLIFRTKKNFVYWMGIILSALFIATVQTNIIIVKVFGFTNSHIFYYFFISKLVLGIVYGWLYWKHGLAISMMASASLSILMLIFA